MEKSNFLLQKARELMVENQAHLGKNPVHKKTNRRHFLRTLGLGTLAVNPAVGAVKKFSEKPFEIVSDGAQMQIWRHGELKWDLSKRFFSPKTQISVQTLDKGYTFDIENLELMGTQLNFNLKGSIFQTLTQWLIRMEIADLEWHNEVDLITFLDGNNPLSASAQTNHILVNFPNKGNIRSFGKTDFSIHSDWSIELNNNHSISFELSNKVFHTHQAKLISGFKNTLLFINQEVEGSLIQLQDFKDWNKWLQSLKYNKKIKLNSLEQPTSLNIASGFADDKEVQTLWTYANNNSLEISGLVNEKIVMKDYFFFQDLQTDLSEFYLSANLPNDGQWISNPVGSFKLIQNKSIPDWEVFGAGFAIGKHCFKPRLKAFHPNIKDGLSATSVYTNPSEIHITDTKNKLSDYKSSFLVEPPQDTTRTKKIIRIQNPNPVNVDPKKVTPAKKEEVKTTPDVKANNPIKEIKINEIKEVKPVIEIQDQRKIKFIPRLPMNFKILRPDDLLWLEVQFKNFKMISGREGTMLELDNKSKPGTIIYSFPTQHTLEEAYFEKTNVDGGSTPSKPINLPARHIRAKKSRLVYEYAANQAGFAFNMHELLDWSKFTLKVHPRAYIKLNGVITALEINAVNTAKAKLISGQSLTTKNNFYNTQIVEKSKLKSDKLAVYDKTVINAVLPANITPTLETNFIASALIQSMKVEPIPDDWTSIEAPALMYISPNQVNDFSHKVDLEYRELDEKPTIKPNANQKQIRPISNKLTPIRSNVKLNFSKGQVAELWHTSLGIKLKNNQIALHGLDRLKTIRALWAFDAYPHFQRIPSVDDPFLASLNAADRHILVHTTSNYEISGYSPAAVPVKKLMLTGLGAYLDWHAFFDVPSPADTYLNIIEWEHLATLGRDHYVKIVKEGYLFPLRHKAALVKITERKFDASTKAAVNMQRMYIVILEKEVLYQRTDPKNQFIKFPFQAVKIENDYTPNIDQPNNIAGLGNDSYNFYIKVAGKPFLFDITATDKEGNEQHIKMPLAFLENITARTIARVNIVINNYNNNNKDSELNAVPFNGQPIAFAESLLDGDTSFETQQFRFGGIKYEAAGEASVKFHPVMQSAEVYIEAVDKLTGKHEPAHISLEDDKNQGMVFASVIDAIVDFSGGSDKSGGFVMPNMNISGLSKLQGPVGGQLDNLMKLEFIPTDFFGDLDDLHLPKLFGAIKLVDLLAGTNITGAVQALISAIKQFREEVERLKNEILLLQEQALQAGKEAEHTAKETIKKSIEEKKNQLKAKATAIQKKLSEQAPKIPNLKTWFTTEAFYAEYKWVPDFDTDDKGNIDLGIIIFHVDKPKEALQITTTFSKPFDGLTTATLDGKAELNKFSIEIKDMLKVNFNQMKFISGSSKKTDIKVDMDKAKPIEFKGALSFVNNLQSLIPATGFSDDGPYVNLTYEGVKAGFNMSVPDVEVGAFSLSNMTLGAYVNLPFNGDELTIGFNFCTRENPFLLTVSGFGGGGYFLMVTTLNGLKSVEAAFEFGASVSLNLGVASGGVTIMGGFYFKYELVETKEEITLTGYVRINGRLSVLGLISVSLEFYLALEAMFETVNGERKVVKMQGVAKLKVKIEILFFSKTVSITVRREFAGADADPTFAEMVLPEDWNEYCLAFAG